MDERLTLPVYLSLGSNLGDRLANLRSAVELLRAEIAVSKVSSLYDTDPVGETDQPPFLNIVLEGETDAQPEGLLRTVKRIEHDVGRRPTYRWGPRVVDIDILLYGDVQIETPKLTIPHLQLTRRRFVLEPLLEVAPDLVHPVEGRTVRQLYDQLGAGPEVRRVGPYQAP